MPRYPDLTEMDYVRDALANALHSGLKLGDVLEVSIHADTPEKFNDALNTLTLAGSSHD